MTPKETGLGPSRFRNPRTRSTATSILAFASVLGASPSCEPGPEQESILAHTVTLGVREGPGAIPSKPMDLLVQENGDFVLLVSVQAPRPLPMVFDSTGAFLRELGGSGQGPGEFRAAMAGAVLPGDSLIFHDLLLGRASILRSDGTFSRSVSLRGQVSRIAAVSWPDTVLLTFFPSGAAGTSFRLVDLSEPSGRELAAFGDPWRVGNEALSESIRHSSLPVGGSLWVADNLRYRIRQFGLSGEVLHTLAPESDWFLEGVGNLSPDSPPPSGLTGIEQIGGSLIVSGRVASEQWETAWEDAEGSGPVRTPPEPELWDSIIELRSSGSGEVLGSQRIPGIVFRILPDGRVAVWEQDEVGYLFVKVYELHFEGL